MGCLFFKSGHDKIKSNDIPENLWNIKINDIDGNERVLGEFTKNKTAFIFVNVACK
jgi:hypothetical protein